MPIVISTERDENRLTALYDAHYRDLVRLAAVLIDDVGECEELVQDAFARLLGGSVGPGSGREAPYLRSMVLNGARSRLRRRLVRRRHPATVGAPMVAVEDEAVDRLETQRVLSALRGLPARQAEVLALRYQADLSEAEIAAALGISAGSVKTHASRGLATLRRRLGGRT